jgi:hypothetical protein
MLLILILGCLWIKPVAAQKNDSLKKYNSFVGIRFGAALPMGEFASQEYGYGGYALLGTSFGGEAAWFVTPKLGFGFDYSMNSFNFATGWYAEDFYLENAADYAHVSILSGPYKLRTYMAGVYYKIAYSSKFHSTFKLMGGRFAAKSPDQFYGIKTNAFGNLNWWKTGAWSYKFTFLSGVSFEYKLYEQVSLVLQADFTYAKAAFTFVTSGTSSYTDYLKMPVFRLQPGINIHF